VYRREVTEDERRSQLAHALLLALHESGKVQLVNRATAESLASGLGRLLTPSAEGAKLSAWLIDQPGVAEVFATDDELASEATAAPASPLPPARELPTILHPMMVRGTASCVSISASVQSTLSRCGSRRRLSTRTSVASTKSA
jgi:hypothetical protein